MTLLLLISTVFFRCDYNKFLLLTLLPKIRYQFAISSAEEFVLSDAVLVFRPLAKWIVKEMEVMFTIKQTASECCTFNIF